jgi:hypothetical protein
MDNIPVVLEVLSADETYFLEHLKGEDGGGGERCAGWEEEQSNLYM